MICTNYFLKESFPSFQNLLSFLHHLFFSCIRKTGLCLFQNYTLFSTIYSALNSLISISISFSFFFVTSGFISLSSVYSFKLLLLALLDATELLHAPHNHHGAGEKSWCYWCYCGDSVDRC